MKRVAWLVGLGLMACGDDDAGVVSGDVADAAFDSAAPESVAPDSALSDSEDPEVADTAAPDPDSAADGDASPPDTTPALPLPGFGAISGDCGVLDDELASPSPSLFVNRIDFGDDPYDAADIALLTDGGRKILADGNAGGSSILSEVFAFELLARCEGAQLLKTETEIVYDEAAKITDMVLLIDGVRIGANPTRAIGFPFDAPYTVAQAKAILEKKLNDILSSTATVSEGDRWVKQILTVFAYSEAHVASVQTAWNEIDAALRADTIVFVTVTDGSDLFIYSDE